jgi:hypothetical protein
VIACPGSFELSRRPDVAALGSTTSVWAARGSLAHALAEARLSRTQSPVLPGDDFQAGRHSIQVDDRFLDTTDAYVLEIERLIETADWYAVEQRLDLNSAFPSHQKPPVPVFGTCDFVAYTHATRTLTVADFKSGSGVMVRPQDNPQLLAYALGAIELMRNTQQAGGRITGDPLYIALIIVQPNASSTANRVQVWKTSNLDLQIWAESVLFPAIQRTQDEPGTFHPGDHCRFCPGKPLCPALQQAALAKAKQAFEPVTLDNQTLAEYLDAADAAERWIKSVRDLALARLTAQETVPGWAVVPTDPRRSWGDPVQVERTLLGIGVIARDTLYDPPKLKSPAQLQRALTPSAWTLVSPLVQSVSSGVKLARKDR